MVVSIYLALVFCLLCLWSLGSIYLFTVFCDAQSYVTFTLYLYCCSQPNCTNTAAADRRGCHPPFKSIHSVFLLELPWWSLDRAEPLRWADLFKLLVRSQWWVIKSIKEILICIYEIFSGNINIPKPKILLSNLLLPGENTLICCILLYFSFFFSQRRVCKMLLADTVGRDCYHFINPGVLCSHVFW